MITLGFSRATVQRIRKPLLIGAAVWSVAYIFAWLLFGVAAILKAQGYSPWAILILQGMWFPVFVGSQAVNIVGQLYDVQDAEAELRQAVVARENFLNHIAQAEAVLFGSDGVRSFDPPPSPKVH